MSTLCQFNGPYYSIVKIQLVLSSLSYPVLVECDLREGENIHISVLAPSQQSERLEQTKFKLVMESLLVG